MKLSNLFWLCAVSLAAQTVPNPTQQGPAVTPAEAGQPVPIFRINVVSRTVAAVNYHHRTGTTNIDFRGTELMPAARGDARVASQMGSTKIETSLSHMSPPSQFGPEYMTYVLWAISPEGRAVNLGEVVLEGDHARLLSTSDLQTFGLIAVTAEPYFAVTEPSDVVVAENFIRTDTTGTFEQVNAKYELFQRGQYVMNRAQYQAVRLNPKGPLQLSEAENAIEIARLAGADHYAADTFQKATLDLQNAEDLYNHGRNRKEAETDAREAAQMAEDARIITFRKMREEQLANERAAAAQAQAQAQLDQQRRSEAEADRAVAQQAAAQAAQDAAQAARDAAQAARDKADAVAQQQAAQAEADRARQTAQQAEDEKAQLRERLHQQLSLVLETRETARGLIVNISDVLFDFNKYTLKPDAREKMAKVAGILLAYPGLKIQVEGHTDSVGTDEYNMKLSRQRADSVQDYLVAQGVSSQTVSSLGLGKADPVASNDTATGRQQNRRVELVVSGEQIGVGLTPQQ